MTAGLQLTGVTIPEFALRLVAVRGTAAYAAYLAESPEIPDIVGQLREELTALDPALGIAVLDLAADGSVLINEVDVSEEIILVNAANFREEDWLLLDRRRSSLARARVTVFATTHASFEHLMRVAPNLASWLGALVFQHAREDAHLLEDVRV